jgi:hypothetical protein
MTAGPYSPGAWVPTFVVQNLVTNFGAGGNPAVEDLQWSGTSLPRGVVLHEQIGSVVAFPASANATAVLYTTASIAWQPGRAYRVEHLGVYRAASHLRPALQIRKTNASGTNLVEGARPVMGTDANTDEPVSRIGYVVNDTAAVVNAPLALVFTQPATAVSGQLTGATGAGAPWVKVTDEGKALSAGGKIQGVSV